MRRAVVWTCIVLACVPHTLAGGALVFAGCGGRAFVAGDGGELLEHVDAGGEQLGPDAGDVDAGGDVLEQLDGGAGDVVDACTTADVTPAGPVCMWRVGGAHTCERFGLPYVCSGWCCNVLDGCNGRATAYCAEGSCGPGSDHVTCAATSCSTLCCTACP